MQLVSSDTVLNATKWSVLINVLRKLVTPITNMILARILAPDAFGVVATITIVTSFAEVFTDAGFQKYIIQHEFDNEKELNDNASVAFWSNLFFSIIVWFIIVLFRNVLAFMVGSEGYGLHLAVASLSVPLIACSSIQQAILKRKFDFKAMFFPGIVNSFVPLLVTVPLAFIFKNCWALIIGTLAGNLTNAVIYFFVIKWKPQLSYSFKLLKEMVTFSSWTMVESVVIWLTTNIDIFILGRLFSEYNMGLYKAGLTTINGISSIFTGSLVPVLFSTLSRLQSNEQFNVTFYSFQRNTSLLVLPISIGVFIYSDIVTRVLLGKQWMEISGYIGLLGLFQAGNILISCFASEVYRAKGEPKVSVFVQLVYVAFLAFTLSLATELFTFQSVCKLRAGSVFFFMLIHTVVLCKRYKFSLRLLYTSALYSIIPTIIMGGIAYIMHSVIDKIIVKMATVLICAIVYIIMCFAIPNTRRLVLDFLKRKHS